MKLYIFKVKNEGLTKVVNVYSSSKKKAIDIIKKHPTLNNPVLTNL